MPLNRILDQKNAIITGTSSGIGRAAVEVFACNGANIWACARQKNSEFENFLYDLSQKNEVWIRPLYFDIIDKLQMKQAVQEIRKSKDRVDILVNNAGASYDALLPMISSDKAHKLMEVNFFSQLQLTQYITRLMAREKSGNVVFTGSYLGIEGNKGQTIYSASKAAIHATVRSLSKELAEDGIRVNAVAPGVVDTKLICTMTEDDYRRNIEKCAMKRAANPKEIANVMMLLASDYSSYVTGQIVRVDGGM